MKSGKGRWPGPGKVMPTPSRGEVKDQNGRSGTDSQGEAVPGEVVFGSVPKTVPGAGKTFK